ncbi:hypothetical protein DMENIID0001_032210 [Sergentomyia squamirostris]
MDLLSAIRPSIRIQNLVGVSPYSVQKNEGIVATKLSLVPGLCLATYVFLAGYLTFDLNPTDQVKTMMFNSDLSAGSILVLSMMLGGAFSMFSYLFSTFMSYWNRQKYIQFYEKLFNINKRLVNAGAAMNFRTVHRFQWLMIGIIVIYNGTQISFGILLAVATPIFIHIGICFTLFNLVNAISAKDIIMVCQVVTKHFICLQEVAKKENLDQDELPDRLEILYHIHADLCECFDLITANFGIRELLNVISDFIFVTSQLFFTFYSINEPHFGYVVFGATMVLLPRCLKVFLIMYSGEELIRTAHATSKKLEDLDKPYKRAEFHDLAHNFALQVLHLQDLDITATNFFSLRLTFLFTLVSACVMYFIVLIQFRLREE